MAIMPVMKDGLPLMIGDPLVPAMADEGNECDCCEEDDTGIPCAFCPDGLPETVTLTVAGMVEHASEDFCPDCDVLNGIYLLTTRGDGSCEWDITVPLDSGSPCTFGGYTHFYIVVRVTSTQVQVSLILYIGEFPTRYYGSSYSRENENCLPDLTGSFTAIAGPSDGSIGVNNTCEHDGASAWTLAP